MDAAQIVPGIGLSTLSLQKPEDFSAKAPGVPPESICCKPPAAPDLGPSGYSGG